jgi:hypothetical protein
MERCKMKISTISWNDLSDEINSLNCPVCNQTWIRDGSEYDPSKVEPCEHLRFRLLDCYDPEWFGDWNHLAFLAELEVYYSSNYDLPDDEDFSFSSIDDDILDILRGMDSKMIDEVLILEEEGLACGPSSMTILYGVKYDK